MPRPIVFPFTHDSLPAQWESKCLFALLATTFLTIGCASPPSQVHSDSLEAPSAGQALVVFMRPSAFAGGARSLVLFDITEGTEILGIFKNGMKTVATFAPGARIFMGTSGGERTIMKAELEAGKIYYVRVSYRHLTALSPERHSQQIRAWWAATRMVGVGEYEEEWRRANLSSIESHKQKALETWDGWTDAQRSKFHLDADEGVNAPVL